MAKKLSTNTVNIAVDPRGQLLSDQTRRPALEANRPQASQPQRPEVNHRPRAKNVVSHLEAVTIIAPKELSNHQPHRAGDLFLPFTPKTTGERVFANQLSTFARSNALALDVENGVQFTYAARLPRQYTRDDGSMELAKSYCLWNPGQPVVCVSSRGITSVLDACCLDQQEYPLREPLWVRLLACVTESGNEFYTLELLS